jgi:hypothetical protein
VPNISALRARGVAFGGDGDAYEASGPDYVSLPRYAEMLTGRAGVCANNECDRRPEHTLADSFVDAGASMGEVAVIASWEKLELVASRDPSGVLISAGRHGGATCNLLATDTELGGLVKDAEDASPAPGREDYRPDGYTSALAMKYLEKDKPRFLFVALGDTDEYGHQDDYAGYLDALRTADAMVGETIRITSKWEAMGDETLILVTADHGRAEDFQDHGQAYPESRRTWLVGAASSGAPQLKRLGSEGRLADIAPSVEQMLKLVHNDYDSGAVIAELRAENAGEMFDR